MAPVVPEIATAKTGLDSPIYEEYAKAKHEALVEEAKRRVPPTNGKRTTFTTMEPPRDVEYNKDKRGFPVDVDGWNVIFQLQKTKPFYVFGIRCFYIWVYASDLAEEDRTPVQQRAVDEYEIPDWMNILGVIGTHGDDNLEAKRRFPRLKRDSIGYDPMLLAQMIQYREMPVRGCSFIDDAWSLDARCVRGYNLQLALNIKYKRLRRDSAPTAEERAIRLQLEKSFMEIAITPGLYASRIQARGLHISLVGVPQNWPDHEDVNIGPDELITWMTKCGVSIAMIEDAYFYADSWVTAAEPPPAGWTPEEVSVLQGSYEPPAGNASEPTVITRSPFTPWQYTPDNLIQYEFSYWCMDEISGLRRPKDSVIAKVIRERPPRMIPGTGIVRRVTISQQRARAPWRIRRRHGDATRPQQCAQFATRILRWPRQLPRRCINAPRIYHRLSRARALFAPWRSLHVYFYARSDVVPF
jgi:hypothetical protein